ncbi:MAG: hypothetical protein ACM3PY_07460 [Omnitrophica WOR_2 bacterium]
MTSLELPRGSRALQLFNHLEQDFQLFLEQLPPGLRELAYQQNTYHGDDSARRFTRLKHLNPVLVGTPWLFWDTFQSLDDELILCTAEAGAYFVLASVLLDHLLDSQTRAPGLLAMYHQALYSRGLSGYRRLFPAQSPFWDPFDRLANEHLAGLSAEHAAQSRPEEFNFETLKVIAHGKVAPIVATLLALSAASGQMDLFPAMEASLKHISVASQLLDDIGDWQPDLRDRHLTYFLTLLDSPESWTQAEWPAVEKLQAVLDAGWIDVDGFKAVMQDLDRAIEAVRGMNCPAWVAYVDGYRKITDGHLERSIRRHLQRTFNNIGS